MALRCVVCKRAFKDLSALQKHSTAFGHNDPAADKASGETTFKDQSLTKSNPSNIAPSTTKKVESSGSRDLHCGQCSRSFASQGALTAHAKAKNHSVANTANLKTPGKTVIRCHLCKLGDFVDHDALSDHKCDFNKHQALEQERAPLRMPSEIGKKANHRSRLTDGHASIVSVDKAVQCNLCSCNSSLETTHESNFATRTREGDEQQKMFQYNPGNQPHPLAIGHMYYSGLSTSFQEMVVSPKECATEATSQQSTLIKERGMDGVPPARSSMLINQASHTEDLLAQYSQTLQGPLNLINVYGSTTPEQLKHLDKEWSTILLSEQPLTLKILRNLCHPASDLENNGYLLRQYTLTDLLGRQRCKGCKKRQGDIQGHQIPCNARPKGNKNKRLIQNKEHQAIAYNASAQGKQTREILPSHVFPTIDRRKQNRYLKTSWTPDKDPLNPKCPAVALDCEMADVVGAGGLWREVIKVSAVDFLSGETLLDTLVLPTAKVRRWKTEITGITDQIMTEAKARGQTVRGWTEARFALWQHIDASTVLIGQSLHYDLEVLGMLHTQIVDSAILAAKAINVPNANTVGLKKMCKEILNMDIQCTHEGMHECLEDALASREIVLHFIYYPEKLQTWALLKREDELEKKARAQRRKEKSKATASHQNPWKRTGIVTDVGDDGSNLFNYDDDDPEDDDDEILRWEDIAEDLGWPHPDTGYDPWSD